MAWEGVEGVGSPVEEEVEGVDSRLSSSIFSFTLFICVSYDFLNLSTLLRSIVTFSGVLSMFILSKTEKVNKKMNPIFEHPVSDSVREKIKRVMRQLEKSREAFENSLYTCSKRGSSNVFSIAKQVRSANEETSVFNECRDCHN